YKFAQLTLAPCGVLRLFSFADSTKCDKGQIPNSIVFPCFSNLLISLNRCHACFLWWYLIRLALSRLERKGYAR
ncbi:MAG: hypothetical protein O7E52_11775, partial [Candidatus Poribacteria bacterium]|nr:hypothetical protein [Candidatus Poribacteria bacterium]